MCVCECDFIYKCYKTVTFSNIDVAVSILKIFIINKFEWKHICDWHAKQNYYIKCGRVNNSIDIFVNKEKCTSDTPVLPVVEYQKAREMNCLNICNSNGPRIHHLLCISCNVILYVFIVKIEFDIALRYIS